MTETVTNNDEDEELEGNIRCPKCGAVLSEDDYDFNFGDGNHKKFDCPECEEVTIEETLFGKAAKVEDGEMTEEEAFGTDLDERDSEELQDQYDQMNEPMEVDVSEEITGEKGTCDNPDCEETDDLRVTKFGTFLCPDHYKGEEA